MNLTPHATVTHWSTRYRGAPWAAGATGPDAFDCWGLVRDVQRAVFGRDLPHIVVGEEPPPQQWRTIRALVQASAWRRIEQLTARTHGDVLFCLGADGLPHVGVLVDRQRVLHTYRGGTAAIDRVDALGGLGFGHLECWRHD
jgi:cell wall-associated NlpC family hydrolase